MNNRIASTCGCLIFALTFNCFGVEARGEKYIRLHLATHAPSLAKVEYKTVKDLSGRPMYVDPMPTFVWKSLKSVQRTTLKVTELDKKTNLPLTREHPFWRIILNDDDAKDLSLFSMPRSFSFAIAVNDTEKFLLFVEMPAKINDGELFLAAESLTPDGVKVFTDLVSNAKK